MFISIHFIIYEIILVLDYYFLSLFTQLKLCAAFGETSTEKKKFLQ